MLSLAQPEAWTPPRRPPSPSLLAQYLQGGQHGPEASEDSGPVEEPGPRPAARVRNPLVFPDLMQKRLERSKDHFLEKRSQDSLLYLVGIARESERRGRGQECSQFSSFRRMRGLDVLHGLPQEEGDGGSEPSVPPWPDRSPSRAGSRTATPSLLLRPSRPSTSASTTSQRRKASVSVSSSGLGRRRSSLLAQGNLAAKRAAEVLRGVGFFQKLEEQSPGTLAQLMVGVTFSSEKAGQVIFREGDPPGSCYVIASGEVGCYKHGNLSPLLGGKKRTRQLPTPRERYEARMFLTLTDSLSKKALAREVGGVPRHATTEGFSTFYETSNLGEEVARLGPGRVVGERALQEEDVRAASVMCLQDCEFIVIQSALYKQVMRGAIEKSGFLNSHLPGLRNLPYAGAEKHPSIMFVLETFHEGHAFLHEGIVALEPAIYVIKRGIVELRRFRHSSHCPAKALAERPLAQPARGPELAQCRGARAEVPLNIPSAADAGEMGVWDALSEGDVFASMAVLPLLSPEPFTAIASTKSGCEVYRAQGVDLLSLSVKLLKPLRRHLMRRLTTRLSRLPGTGEPVLGPSLKQD
mmetsp:Transcript_69046/g.213530  ORF Transcript_69046/g.213530 Transcript_69046/m.213530 type:complete len:580 (+) Transcript_69046:83-1822(+)